MTEIILSSVTGYRNKGVQALVETTIEHLKNHLVECNITVLSETPDYDNLHKEYDDIKYEEDGFVQMYGGRGKILKTLGPFSKILENKIAAKYQISKKTISRADMIIASGGDCFSSDYGDLKRHLLPLEYAIKENKTVVFLAQSIGPFKTNEEVELFKNVARKSKLITVRESLSFKYLTEELLIPKDKVFLTADSAFLLKVPSKEKIKNLLDFYNIDLNKPKLVISVSQGIKTFAGIESDNHFNAWKKIIKTALYELGTQIIIVPHVQERTAFNDDRIVANMLAKEFDYSNSIKVISGDHSSSELKGIISQADLVIAERMHAAIAGLSSKIPTAVIGYSVKAKGILKDIYGQKTFDESLLMPINDLINSDKIEEWVLNLWNKREEMILDLNTQIPKMQELALENFKLIKNIM